MSIETSSISLLAHLDQHAQPYIYQSVIYPSRPERVPRSEERASGRGTNEPSGRRVSGGGKNQPRYIHQMNRHYRAEIKPRVEYYLVQRKMRAVMLSNNPSRPERAAVHLSMNHSSISEGRDSSGGGDHLGQRQEQEAGNRMSIDTPSIPLTIHLGHSAEP